VAVNKLPELSERAKEFGRRYAAYHNPKVFMQELLRLNDSVQDEVQITDCPSSSVTSPQCDRVSPGDLSKEIVDNARLAGMGANIIALLER